jgi:Copper resistance protein D.
LDWGNILFVFTLLPTLSKLKEINREKMSLALIPRFSIAFIISIGIVIITGPTLMWFLESDVGLITDSVYGQLIMLKIAIAAVMISLGGFFQF